MKKSDKPQTKKKKDSNVISFKPKEKSKTPFGRNGNIRIIKFVNGDEFISIVKFKAPDDVFSPLKRSNKMAISFCFPAKIVKIQIPTSLPNKDGLSEENTVRYGVGLVPYTNLDCVSEEVSLELFSENLILCTSIPSEGMEEVYRKYIEKVIDAKEISHKDSKNNPKVINLKEYKDFLETLNKPDGSKLN